MSRKELFVKKFILIFRSRYDAVSTFNYSFISEYDPLLSEIRCKEHFKKLMERVKHEWENLRSKR
jgi:hypothetical protein